MITNYFKDMACAIDKRFGNGCSGLTVKAMVDEVCIIINIDETCVSSSGCDNKGDGTGLNLTKSVARTAFGQWLGLVGSETGAYLGDCALGCYTWCPAMDRRGSLAFDLVVK
jgi:hypothetical protein